MVTENSFEVLRQDADHTVGLWRNVSVNVWMSPSTAEQIRRIGADQPRIAQRFPEGFGSLSIMHASNTGMTAEARAAGEKLSKTATPGLRAIAMVIVGTGFAAAGLRAVASTMMMITHRRAPTKIFGDPETGARWVLEQLGASPEQSQRDATALLGALEAHGFRKDLEKRASA